MILDKTARVGAGRVRGERVGWGAEKLELIDVGIQHIWDKIVVKPESESLSLNPTTNLTSLS